MPHAIPRLSVSLCSLILMVCGFGLTGCDQSASTSTPATAPSASTQPTASGPLNIVTTTGMVRDVVEQVAGEHATVVGLMGAGVDPHLYKPTRNDLTQILGADVIFYSGLMLEGRMVDAFMQAGRDGKPVYPVTERLDESSLLEPDGFDGHWDPHVWMDVEAWAASVDVIADALVEVDPAHADDYRSNAAAYRTKLEELHAYVQKSISSIPENQRVLITAHDAFNYFGRAYDIEVMGIQGISTESEAGLDDINQLVDLLVERNIGAVFVETSVAEDNVRALVEGAQARGHFSDAMGAKGTYQDTYIGMIDHNATAISRALGGNAPEAGFKGKLGEAAH